MLLNLGRAGSPPINLEGPSTRGMQHYVLPYSGPSAVRQDSATDLLDGDPRLQTIFERVSEKLTALAQAAASINVILFFRRR